MGYLWNKHLFEASTRFHNEFMNISASESTSASDLAALLLIGQN
jgi:hypothetical protein